MEAYHILIVEDDKEIREGIEIYLVSAEQLKILINTEFSSIFCYNNCMEQRYNRFIFLQNSYKSQEMPCIRHQIKASPHYLILTSPSDSG